MNRFAANAWFAFSARTVTVCALTMAAGHAVAQSTPAAPAPAAAAPAANKVSDAELLRDFIHYVKVARYDVAGAMGDELLRRKISPADFVTLVETGDELGRFEDAVGRAMKVGEIEATAGSLSKLYQTGKVAKARNPDEISKNIAMLVGPVRGKILARERLIPAGEYAMPQLLEAMLDRGNLALQAEATTVIRDMGRHAVTPLTTALPNLEPGQQEMVVDVLGAVGRRAAIPAIAELRSQTSVAGVKAACDRAIDRLGGAGADTSTLYTQLAEAYYSENTDLTCFPGEDHQLIWSFVKGGGLSMQAIRTPVFNEAMAMRCAEKALNLNPANGNAVTTWVASNFSREIDTPENYQNPEYGANRREAMYYAVAAGPNVSQQVLARALTGRDTPLARKALAAVEKTAGNSVLVPTSGGSSALVDALSYPNRRVQYDAALAISAAAPAQPFPGSERVVPTLASAIRDAGTQYAVVIANDNESYQSVRKILEKSKYQVLPFGKTLADIAAPVSEAPGVDLVVIANLSAAKSGEVVGEIRSNSRTSAAPALILAPADSIGDLRNAYSRDRLVAVRSVAMGEETISKAAESLVQTGAGGGITGDEAKAFAGRSLAALRDLAVSGNQALKVEDASAALVGALANSKIANRSDVADVLARVGQPRAQIALADAALDASGSEQVLMLDKVTQSARRFGNMLESRHIPRLMEVASKGNGPEATAAAAAIGALGVSNTDLVPLITGKAK